MSDLAILTPVRRRPHRVAPLLDSIAKATPRAHVIFVADEDDPDEIQAIQEERDGRPLVITTLSHRERMNYATKINHAIGHADAPLLFFGADDLEYRLGWFETARQWISDVISVVGVNDLCSGRTRRGEHATHFLVDRRYARRRTIDNKSGPLYEGYRHWCVDDEFLATARQRGVLKIEPEAIVEHLHPDAGKAPWDETYADGHAGARADLRLLHRRKRLWT